MPYIHITIFLTLFANLSIQSAQETYPIRIAFNVGMSIASFRLPTNSILNHIGVQPPLMYLAAQSGLLNNPFVINVPKEASYQEVENMIIERLQALVQPFNQQSIIQPPVLSPENMISESIQPQSDRAQQYLVPQGQNNVVIPVQPAGPPLPSPFIYQPSQTPKRRDKCCSCSCVINFPH